MSTFLKKCGLLFLFCMVASFRFVFGQPYYFAHYQVENGLSNNAVMCSLQDHLGFMWFGTRDGLNRFDGLSFKVFRNNPDDTASIGSNALNCLYEDQQKRLWAGTEKGLFSYNSKKETFTQLKVAGNYSIQQVKVTGSNIWYISLFTLSSFNEKTGQLKTYKFDKEVTSYCLMKDNTVWVATSAGIIARYNSYNDTFTEYDVFTHSPYAVSKSIETIFDTGTGLLLIGTSNQGLKSFDISTATYKDLLTLDTDDKDIIVRQIIATGKDEYWVATQSGIYILKLKTGKFVHLKKELNDPYTLSDNIVHTLYHDKEGGIWAGTYFGGINYYPRQYVTFKKYFPKSGANSISGSAVREISSDSKGNLWIGTEDAGLSLFNPRTGRFTNFTAGSSSQSLSYSNIHGLLTNGNEVWVGTYLHGLDVLDAASGKRIQHYNTGNSALGSNFIYGLFKTNDNQIIAATDKGLFRYISAKNDFQLITEVPNYFFRTLCQDGEGTIWAGTYGNGIYFFNTQTAVHGQFTFNHNDLHSLASNQVNNIFKDHSGIIWVATEGGLCRYISQSKQFERYTMDSGLPSNVTYSVLEDANNNLWISTSKGLVCFSPSSKHIQAYTKAHGLLTDQFNYNSGCKDENGNLYFGSVKGLITFHPDSIKNNTFAPPVYITGFQVYNKELSINDSGSPLKNAIIYTRNITLEYDQSSFSIDFAALSFTAPATIRYAYKLEGLDKDWTYLETNRKAYFTELKPGSYTFYVKALNGADNNFGNPAMLHISILPPAWKSWWAYTAYVLLLMLLAYFIIRHFSNQAKERHKRKLEKLEYDKERENYRDKINFFTNVAHEIRTPLTLIKGPMENIMDRAEEIPAIKASLDIMNRNTDRLLHLSNQLLDFRKVEMKGFLLNFSKQNIPDILSLHEANFALLAQQKNIRVTTSFPSDFFAAIDLDAFNKIISNLWDNATKYAQSQVHVALTPTAGQELSYQITFKNDGYLIPPELREKIFESFYRIKKTDQLPGTGIGLTLSRTLAEMHGGSLQLDTEEKFFNVFLLTLLVNPKQA